MQSHKLGYFIFFALTWLFCSCASNQYGRSRMSSQYYSNRYKGRLLSAKKQCDRAMRKKYKRQHKKLFAWSSKSNARSTPSAMAEVDPNDTPPPVKPKPKPKPKPEPTPPPEKPEEDPVAKKQAEEFDNLSMEEKYKREREVLEVNNLPTPTNEQQQRISERVMRDIANDNFPQNLEPLYFLVDEDEFAVVDFEPFLVAVEYALQGKIILVEGHTDNTGDADYNMQLSIKRVEKIRSLMHDMGVPDERISVVGYGEEEGKYDNNTKEGRQKNRRVDFRIF